MKQRSLEEMNALSEEKTVETMRGRYLEPVDEGFTTGVWASARGMISYIEDGDRASKMPKPRPKHAADNLFSRIQYFKREPTRSGTPANGCSLAVYKSCAVPRLQASPSIHKRNRSGILDSNFCSVKVS